MIFYKFLFLQCFICSVFCQSLPFSIDYELYYDMQSDSSLKLKANSQLQSLLSNVVCSSSSCKFKWRELPECNTVEYPWSTSDGIAPIIVHYGKTYNILYVRDTSINQFAGNLDSVKANLFGATYIASFNYYNICPPKSPSLPPSPPPLPPPLERQAITALIDQAVLSSESSLDSFNMTFTCNPGRFIMIYELGDSFEVITEIFNKTNYTYVFAPESPGIYNTYCDDTYPVQNLNPIVLGRFATTGFENITTQSGTEIVQSQENYEVFAELLNSSVSTEIVSSYNLSETSTKEQVELIQNLNKNIQLVAALEEETKYKQENNLSKADNVVTYSITSLLFSSQAERDVLLPSLRAPFESQTSSQGSFLRGSFDVLSHSGGDD